MLFSDQESGTSYIGTSNSEISWDWSHETWSHEVSWEFSSREVILEKIPISLKVMRRDWDPALEKVRYTRNFYYRDFWRTFSCRPTSLSLFYSMVSCKGELRNGKKYAQLAYFMTISGNSGVQKRMAFGGSCVQERGGNLGFSWIPEFSQNFST